MKLNKLKAAVTAAFLSVTALATSLTASAVWLGTNAGDINNASFTETNTPYGYFTGSDQFAWRVNLYVSSNPDGKINKDSDRIGSPQLPLVGSLLCTGDKWDTTTVGTTYLQTNYTDTTRDRFDLAGYTSTTDANGNKGVMQYTLPTLMEFSTVREYYTDANGNTVVVNSKGIYFYSSFLFSIALTSVTSSANSSAEPAGKP